MELIHIIEKIFLIILHLWILEYMQYRADPSCKIGVIAHDPLDEELIPFGFKDDMLLGIIDNSLKDTPVFGNWSILKEDYLNQSN